MRERRFGFTVVVAPLEHSLAHPQPGWMLEPLATLPGLVHSLGNQLTAKCSAACPLPAQQARLAHPSRSSSAWRLLKM